MLGLVTGCGSTRLGPHRIDVQQGNAIDQENIARLKPGLSRSQVRFLLGTPLVIDPFRNDRWDYIYTFHKAGKLTEEKRVTLHFDGDLLARIEGDVPAVAAPSTAVAQSEETTPQPKLAQVATPGELAAAVPRPAPVVVPAVPVQPAAPLPAPIPVVPMPPAPTPVATPPNVKSAPAPVVAAGVVTPLPSPKNVPAYVDPRPPAELALQAEINVAQLKPDVIPPFPDPAPASATPQPAVGDVDALILQALEAWAAAWGRRDEVKYLAAYADSFVPQGGGSRADWAQRRRLLLGIAKNIEVRIDSPSVERAGDGSALLTFNQFYRSESYRDAVVKQLRMVEQQGRWLIVEEKVLSVLRGKP